MDGISIVDLVSQLGFPIGMCLLMFWYMTKQAAAHKEETDKLRDAIDGNTQILTRLYERLGGDH